MHEPEAIRRPALAVLFAALLAVVALPVLTHPQPPLIDYINHLARTYAISTIGTDTDLQRSMRSSGGSSPI
jgi:hypothetical protein